MPGQCAHGAGLHRVGRRVQLEAQVGLACVQAGVGVRMVEPQLPTN